ncbi:MAG: Ribonuclease P protein component 1 [Cenarchaeum symbiont of Oopsacas minuta]|nr:Ribonuclease P protein component 1 [Cenarchaeum symbiont of Oopsacas minuta]
MITAENLHMHELVGLYASVSSSCNPQMIGISGTVLHESKHMLHIRTGADSKMYPKSGSTWEFTVHDSKYTINGMQIMHRSHERITK